MDPARGRNDDRAGVRHLADRRARTPRRALGHNPPRAVGDVETGAGNPRLTPRPLLKAAEAVRDFFAAACYVEMASERSSGELGAGTAVSVLQPAKFAFTSSSCSATRP